jgi:hypothetical protein
MKKNYKNSKDLLSDFNSMQPLTKEQLEILFNCVLENTYRARHFCYDIANCRGNSFNDPEFKEILINYINKLIDLKGLDYIKKSIKEIRGQGCKIFLENELINPNKLSSNVWLEQYDIENPSIKYSYLDKGTNDKKMKSYSGKRKASDEIIKHKLAGFKITKTKKDVFKAPKRSGKNRNKRLCKEKMDNQLNN